jgi:ribosomal protein L13E
VDGNPLIAYMSTCCEGGSRLRWVRRTNLRSKDLSYSGGEPIFVGQHQIESGSPVRSKQSRLEAGTHMWGKKDWQQFFEISTKRPWNRRRPPRPVYSAEANRITPAVGFSLSELDDAGINIDQAETFGLPVDAGRIGAYGPNVSALREFARSARRPA